MRIDDVAAALGVSKGTVSRAITGNGRIAAETKRRVLAYMREHDYQPSAIAQSFSKGKTMNIALTVPTSRELIQLPFFFQFLGGVLEVAVGNSYDVLVVDNSYQAVKRVVSQRKVDGVVISRNLVGSRMLGYVADSGLPFVLAGTTGRPDVVQVDHDHRLACREFTSIMLKQWEGTAGLIAGDHSHLVSRIRARGFSEAAKSAPIIWEAVDEESIIAAFHELRSQGVDIFFCEDDMICTYLENALRAGKLGGDPEAVRVASFYSSTTLEAMNPRIPALRFDAVGLGVKACEALVAQMSGGDVGNATLGHEIVIPEAIDTTRRYPHRTTEYPTHTNT